MLPKMVCRLFALLLVFVECGSAQTTVPHTPAGHTLQAWLDAFNSGDRSQIETYVKTVPSKSVDLYVSFRNKTGGFELLSIESSEPLHVRFGLKAKTGSLIAFGNLLVKDGQPPTVVSFVTRLAPPGQVYENVTVDAASGRRWLTTWRPT
jgi:retinol-binding protein 3